MFYSPKHAAPKTGRVARRAAGVAVAGAATVGGATVTASPASAATVWDRVAQCESGGRWGINTGNGYYGGLQFSYGTWRGYGGQRYARTANLATKAQQITIAKKVLQSQGPGAWPTCGRRAGLTRANGGAAGAGAAEASRSAARPAPAKRGKLVVDGIRGPKTNRAIERWVGGSVNGRLNGGDVRKLEKKVGGSVNGRMSRDDVTRLQRTVGAKATGRWDRTTNRALQRYLNRL
jgi:hypothetical protein